MDKSTPSDDAPIRLLPAAVNHLADVEDWPEPAAEVDPDLMVHGLLDPPVAERQTPIRGLYQATYTMTVPTPNYSSRGGRKIRVGIFHTGETGNAAGDNGSAVNLAQWFARPEAKSSAHACADSDRLVRGVPCHLAAWTCRGANSIGVQLELATRAKRTLAQWNADPGMLEIAAQWAAAESEEHGLPLVVLSPSDYNAGKWGFMDHDTYTDATGDGSHWDCGENFPIQRVLDRAKVIRSGTSQRTNPAPTPAPSTTTDEWEAIMAMFNSRDELAAFLRQIVAEESAKVTRSEGVAGAGDLGRLSNSLIPQVKRVVGEELDARSLGGQ